MSDPVAVSLFVVLPTFVDVRVSPLEQRLLQVVAARLVTELQSTHSVFISSVPRQTH
jgi:hypothetical protein